MTTARSLLAKLRARRPVARPVAGLPDAQALERWLIALANEPAGGWVFLGVDMRDGWRTCGTTVSKDDVDAAAARITPAISVVTQELEGLTESNGGPCLAIQVRPLPAHQPRACLPPAPPYILDCMGSPVPYRGDGAGTELRRGGELIDPRGENPAAQLDAQRQYWPQAEDAALKALRFGAPPLFIVGRRLVGKTTLLGFMASAFRRLHGDRAAIAYVDPRIEVTQGEPSPDLQRAIDLLGQGGDTPRLVLIDEANGLVTGLEQREHKPNRWQAIKRLMSALTRACADPWVSVAMVGHFRAHERILAVESEALGGSDTFYAQKQQLIMLPLDQAAYGEYVHQLALDQDWTGTLWDMTGGHTDLTVRLITLLAEGRGPDWDQTRVDSFDLSGSAWVRQSGLDGHLVRQLKRLAHTPDIKDLASVRREYAKLVEDVEQGYQIDEEAYAPELRSLIRFGLLRDPKSDAPPALRTRLFQQDEKGHSRGNSDHWRVANVVIGAGFGSVALKLQLGGGGRTEETDFVEVRERAALSMALCHHFDDAPVQGSPLGLSPVGVCAALWQFREPQDFRGQVRLTKTLSRDGHDVRKQLVDAVMPMLEALGANSNRADWTSAIAKLQSSGTCSVRSSDLGETLYKDAADSDMVHNTLAPYAARWTLFQMWARELLKVILTQRRESFDGSECAVRFERAEGSRNGRQSGRLSVLIWINPGAASLRVGPKVFRHGHEPVATLLPSSRKNRLSPVPELAWLRSPLIDVPIREFGRFLLDLGLPSMLGWGSASFEWTGGSERDETSQLQAISHDWYHCELKDAQLSGCIIEEKKKNPPGQLPDMLAYKKRKQAQASPDDWLFWGG